MNLRVLGSSSSGNCYIIENEKEALLLEAGLPYSKISEAIDFNYEKISICLVSHEHGDHTYSLDKLDGLVDILCSKDIADKKGIRHYTESVPLRQYKFGGFTIMPFDVIHDVYCQGFFIEHIDMGRLAFITDSAYADYTFVGLNHLLVECNYNIDELNRSIDLGITPAFQKRRLLSTHMEVMETVNVIKSNLNEGLNNVILLHLSERNSNEMEIVKTIKEETGINAKVAYPGVEINLTKNIY